jgi:hypothetical protein
MAAIGGVITIKLLDRVKTVHVAKSILFSQSSSIGWKVLVELFGSLISARAYDAR